MISTFGGTVQIICQKYTKVFNSNTSLPLLDLMLSLLLPLSFRRRRKEGEGGERIWKAGRGMKKE